MITNVVFTSPELPMSAPSDAILVARSRRSICVNSLSYDNEQRELTVALPNGSYVFHGVTPSVFVAFLRAPSLGGFFNRFIRNVYDSSGVYEL